MNPIRLRYEASPADDRGMSTAGRVGAWLFGRTPVLAAPWTALLLLIAAIGLAWTLWQAALTARALGALREAGQARQSAQAARDAVAAAPSPQQRQADVAWEDAVRRTGMPWAELFERLQQSTPNNIVVTALQVDGAQRRAVLQVEGARLDTVLAYVDALRRAGMARQVVPVRHEAATPDAARPVRLTLELHLREDGMPAEAARATR